MLPVGQKKSHDFFVGFVHDLASAQRSFSFPCLLGQNVAAMRFIENELSGAGSFESFRGGSIAFDFRHIANSPCFGIHARRTIADALKKHKSPIGGSIVIERKSRTNYAFPHIRDDLKVSVRRKQHGGFL